MNRTGYRKKWTKEGMAKLGVMVKRSRQDAKMSLRYFSQICSDKFFAVNYTALKQMEQGKTCPAYNLIEAIAASGLLRDDSGKLLGIYECIDIISQTPYVEFPVSKQRKRWVKDGLYRLGGLIKSTREKKGITKQVLADMCSSQDFSLISRTIWTIESGRVIPSFNTLEAIADTELFEDNTGSVLDIYNFIDIASGDDFYIRLL